MYYQIRDYLTIEDDYEANRYSLSWSTTGDAVERPDGSTFAFAAEIGLFLEGYALIGPPIHFSYILYLLQRFDSRLAEPEQPGDAHGIPGPELIRKSDALAIAFRETGRRHRNAGALCAYLCREIPVEPDPPDMAKLCFRLSNPAMMAQLAMDLGTAKRWDGMPHPPPLGALDFELHFLNALKQLSPSDIEAWLRHGDSAKPDPGERVATTIEALRPPSLEGVLATLAGRERLANAVPMVAQLVGALTLPPRRLAHRALPTGGYADIGTRGRPEQILPSQFAIDDIEFLRRFAENELLYFHREEPHATLTEELVLLMDQGVRTWGRVRHALSASALALGRLAARRGLPLLVGSTGSEGRLLDPLRADPDALGAFWEATDLTPGPGPALGEILKTGPGVTRDVVVLTHPRNAASAEFSAEARQAPPGTRVFSVSIDQVGAVEFREWRPGGPVKVGDFRVDYTPPRVSPEPGNGPEIVDPLGWRGDVEPVGYPFRLGVVHRIDRPLFDFDYSARWLLLCTHRGILHVWKVDGSRTEVLPRGMFDGEVLEQVDVVLGVADGFVVGGRVGKMLVAMHYDLAARLGKAHVLGPILEGRWEWFYSRPSHTVVARGRSYSRAVDLSTGEHAFSKEGKTRPSPRAIRAFEMAANHSLPPPALAIVDEASPAPDRGRSIRLDRQTGEVRLSGESVPWSDFVPLADGRPALAGCWIDQAQLRGNVLALLVSGPIRGSQGLLLRLFTHPAGVPSHVLHPISSDAHGFILSEDGRLIARRLGERQIEVREITGALQPVLVTAKGKTHSDLKLTLGRYGMVVKAGKHANLIRWDRGRLDVSTIAEGSTRSEFEVIPWAIDRPASRSTPRPGLLSYDPRRFLACARAELTAVVDSTGQVSLFDRNDRLLAMFVAFRSQVAAWMPDGTRFGPSHGPSALVEGPTTPDAAERIGQVLRAASDANFDLANSLPGSGSS
ncbi:hypothetical protein P12x_000748 [Tundrisphaera lichenicola]|uniref:hypothetical protein n=1 Tax=Tundrisphaera lichenicola TaxID=2029860 RepID=UPI003EB87734